MGLKFRTPVYREPQLKTCRLGHKYKWSNGARLCECDMTSSGLVYEPEGITR